MSKLKALTTQETAIFSSSHAIKLQVKMHLVCQTWRTLAMDAVWFHHKAICQGVQPMVFADRFPKDSFAWNSIVSEWLRLCVPTA